MGSHLRVVRPGGPSRPRERLGRSRGREGSQGAPRQAPRRHTGPSGSVCRPGCLAPSHRYPAVADAQAFAETPFIASGPPRALPPLTALGRWASAVWAWVSDDIKGFSRGNMAFASTP